MSEINSPSQCIPFHNLQLLCAEGIDICHEKENLFTLSKLSKIKYKNLRKEFIQSDTPKIPHKIHMIWVTKLNKDGSEISDRNIEIIKKNIIFLKKDLENLEVFFWTNALHSLDKTKKSLDNYVSFRNIQELDNLSPTLYHKLISLINKGYFGMVSDTLRFFPLQKYGGIYIDVNYEFINHISKLTKTYDFFSTIVPPYEYVIEVTPIAAKPNHIIINETIKILERNLLNIESAPMYAQNPCSNALNEVMLKTYVLTGTPLSIAFYKKAHEENNIDIAFPGGVLAPAAAPAHQTALELEAASYTEENLILLGFDKKEESWFKNTGSEEL